MERVGKYAEFIYRELKEANPELVEQELGEGFDQYSQEIFQYHDIGRFFIPISILNKVEKLTDEEFQLIRDHTIHAVPAVERIYKKPFPDKVMRQLLDVAMYHHEAWDGSGYPEKRKEKEIPLGARICAIADTYDGITSWKPYKKKQITKNR